MIKTFVYIFFTVCFLSCDTSNQSDQLLENKLSTDLVSNPQSLENQDANIKDIAIMIFDDTLHDFGKMHEGEIVIYEFLFSNKGNKNLIINEAKGSCGCTVPTFPKEPIKPGENSSIKVTFNSQGKKGYNEKTVMLITNGTPSVLNLYIRAEVN